jgi:hypothetical protein
MPSMELRIATAALFITFASAGVGCAGKLPPVQGAPSAQPPLSVFVEPDATVTKVMDEKGRDIVPLLREALDAGLTEAGYHVVTEPSGKADLTVHMSLAKVGYTKYGTAPRIWAGDVVLDVSGAGKPLAQATRATVNWSDYEGKNIAERLHFTARVLVNSISRAAAVAQYAADHPASASAPAIVTTAPAAPAAPAPQGATPPSVTMGVATPVAISATAPAPAVAPIPPTPPTPTPPAH